MTDILLSGSCKKCFNYSILIVICLMAHGGYGLSLSNHQGAGEVVFGPAAVDLYEFNNNEGSNSNPSRPGGGVWRPNVQYFMKLFRKSPSLKVILCFCIFDDVLMIEFCITMNQICFEVI